MADVFVPDGRSIASLAIVRSLGGRKGVKVTLGNEKRISATSFSKYTSKSIVYSSPEKYPDRFSLEMYTLIKKNKFDVVMPVRDSTSILFSKMKENLSEYTRIPIPDYSTLIKGRNKGTTIKFAQDIDVPCPTTYFEEDLNRLESLIDYPVLIRPCESSGSRGIVRVDYPEDIVPKFKQLKEQYGELMIQEYIPHLGKAYNVSALFNYDSEPCAVFAMEKIRQFPISGGPTAFAKSVKGYNVKKYALKLLKELDWIGVAEVEFIIDERDKKPKLMEINPRFWNPLSLAIQAGIDYPSMLYDLAMDGKVAKVNSYKLDVKWRYFIYDILCYLSSPNKLNNYSNLLEYKDVHDAVLSLNDFGPTVGALLDGFTGLFDHDKRSHVFDRGQF